MYVKLFLGKVLIRGVLLCICRERGSTVNPTVNALVPKPSPSSCDAIVARRGSVKANSKTSRER